MTDTLPFLIEPEALQAILGQKDLLIIDLSKTTHYTLKHIPGAVFLDYQKIIASKPPVNGLLPEPDKLAQTLAVIGWTPDKHVIAYDEEGGAKACRLLWTLHALGHTQTSLLNGGIQAWLKGGFTTDNTIPGIATTPAENLLFNESVIADRTLILQHLQDSDYQLLDVRTRGEYTGQDVRAKKGGHIPGALHYEWTQAINRRDCLRMQPAATVHNALDELGIKKDKTVVTYCHTHHRSAHTWFILKWLGFEHVRGYHGAWSDWGNADKTPVETDS